MTKSQVVGRNGACAPARLIPRDLVGPRFVKSYQGVPEHPTQAVARSKKTEFGRRVNRVFSRRFFCLSHDLETTIAGLATWSLGLTRTGRRFQASSRGAPASQGGEGGGEGTPHKEGLVDRLAGKNDDQFLERWRYLSAAVHGSCFRENR